jgi:hypothetical protein
MDSESEDNDIEYEQKIKDPLNLALKDINYWKKRMVKQIF